MSLMLLQPKNKICNQNNLVWVKKTVVQKCIVSIQHITQLLL